MSTETDAPKGNFMKIVATVTAVLGMIAAVVTFDSRYSNSGIKDAITQSKNEIVNEMRSEDAVNRAALISLLQRNADDLEYEISEFEFREEQAPRMVVDRHKSILRQIEDLKARRHETTTPTD